MGARDTRHAVAQAEQSAHKGEGTTIAEAKIPFQEGRLECRGRVCRTVRHHSPTAQRLPLPCNVRADEKCPRHEKPANAEVSKDTLQCRRHPAGGSSTRELTSASRRFLYTSAAYTAHILGSSDAASMFT